MHLTLALFTVAIALLFAGCDSPEELVGGPSVGASPTADVFRASTGKLPAGVTEKTLNEDATQCEWSLVGKTAGQRIISLHVTPKGTVFGGPHGLNGVYRIGNWNTWEYVPFFPGYEAESEVWDLASTPSGRIYATLYNSTGTSGLSIPNTKKYLPGESKPPTPTPAPSDRGLLISDKGGIAGTWVNPMLGDYNVNWTEKGFYGVATTGNGLVYFTDPEFQGLMHAWHTGPDDMTDPQKLFDGWIFTKLFLTDTHLFAAGHPPKLGILRLELPSDGAPKLLGSSEDPDPDMIFLVGKEVSDLAIGNYGKLLFASTFESGIFRSQDSGHTWASKSIGLPEGAQFEDPQIGKMPQIPAVIATHTGLLFASVAGVGVFVSGNSAESWEPLGKFDLDQPVIEALAFVKGGSLIAGTTNGVYTYPKQCISALAEPAENPRRENRR
jgi:hypothetical protein